MISYKEIEKGNIKLVKQVINKDNVNEHCLGFCTTPLHESCVYGKLDIVKYLVSIGADINLKSYSRQTPLDIAIEFEKDEIKDYLQLVERFKK